MQDCSTIVAEDPWENVLHGAFRERDAGIPPRDVFRGKRGSNRLEAVSTAHSIEPLNMINSRFVCMCFVASSKASHLCMKGAFSERNQDCTKYIMLRVQNFPVRCS
jgi:hypothetical protein